MLVYFSTNLHENLESYSLKAKINSLMLLSFGFYVLKRPAEKNSDAYKPTAGENSSAQHSKTFIKKRASLLTTLQLICPKRIEWLSNVGEL